MEEFKICKSCEQGLPLYHFEKYTKKLKEATSIYYRRSCKSCREGKKVVPRQDKVTYNMNVYEENRHCWLKKTYGITLAEFNTMLDKQGGHCKICQATDKLHVDHCHTTGKIRGILCTNCNTGLGQFKDSPELLKKAIEYLI